MPVSAAKPGAVFGNRPIQFFVSPGRLMLELIEAPDYRHAFISIDGPATGESGTLS